MCVCVRKGVSGWVDVCKVRVMICFMPAEVVCVCVCVSVCVCVCACVCVRERLREKERERERERCVA